MGRKVYLRLWGKTLLGDVNKHSFWKVCWQCPTPPANFPTHDLNFHWRWRWWDKIQAIFLNLFYLKCLFSLTNDSKLTLILFCYGYISKVSPQKKKTLSLSAAHTHRKRYYVLRPPGCGMGIAGYIKDVFRYGQNTRFWLLQLRGDTNSINIWKLLKMHF